MNSQPPNRVINTRQPNRREPVCLRQIRKRHQGGWREAMKKRRSMSWRILARHKWVIGALITESVNDDSTLYRYTATVRGYRNWRIFEGAGDSGSLDLIIRIVRAIRDQIDEEGEDCEAFMAANKYSRDISELEAQVKIFKHPLSEALDQFLSEQ